MRQGRTEAASVGFQPYHVLAADGTGPFRVVAPTSQNFAQGFDLFGWYQQPRLHECAGRLDAAAVMRHRNASNIQVKPEGRTAAVLSPSCKGHCGDCLNDVRRLPQVVKRRSVDDVRLWRSAGACFGFWLHPRTVARRCRKLTGKISNVLRALPGLLVARKAGAVLTGSALAESDASNPGQVTRGAAPAPTIDGALYLAAEVIYAEPWAADYNAAIWHFGTGWRDQADGFFE